MKVLLKGQLFLIDQYCFSYPVSQKVVHHFQQRRAQLLKIHYITRDPPHDSDKNCSLIEGFACMSALSSRPANQAIKGKDQWARFLISLDYVGKQTLLPWVMENGFKVFRKGHINDTNCTMILQNRTDSQTDTKTFRNQRSRNFSSAILTVADENSQRGNVLRRNLSAVQPGLVGNTYQLIYIARNSQT